MKWKYKSFAVLFLTSSLFIINFNSKLNRGFIVKATYSCSDLTAPGGPCNGKYAGNGDPLCCISDASGEGSCTHGAACTGGGGGGACDGCFAYGAPHGARGISREWWSNDAAPPYALIKWIYQGGYNCQKRASTCITFSTNQNLSGGKTKCFSGGTFWNSVHYNCSNQPLPGGSDGCARLGPSATDGGLLSNTLYYYKVWVWYQDPDPAYNKVCPDGGTSVFSTISCWLIPPNQTIPVGQSYNLGIGSSNPSALSGVFYTGAANPYVSFGPNPSSQGPGFTTSVTGTQVTKGVSKRIDPIFYAPGVTNNTACYTTGRVTVTPSVGADPWWQVKDADIASGGDLKSKVVGTNVFDDVGGGGYPGVPTYSGNLTGITSTNVSTKHWIAQSSVTSPKVFNEQFFENQIPAGTTINTIDHLDQSVIDGGTVDATTSYYWYKYDASSTNLDLSLDTPLIIGNKKIILLIKGADFHINSTINGITRGQGFFMVSVGRVETNGGDVVVGTGVGGGATANLEGIYITDGAFSDGTLAPGANDNKLWIRGSVVAYANVTLQRDVGDIPSLTIPSELFEYAPDQIMLFPKVLATRKINWKEVAP